MPARPDPVKQDRIEQAMADKPRDVFSIDPMPLMRDAMRAQSERAKQLAREAGLEVPSAHD